VAPMADPIKIVVLDGDETGQELLEQAIRVLEPALLGIATCSSTSIYRSSTAARPPTRS
jgi:isocitrate/isopropylmalate dehydrogenase